MRVIIKAILKIVVVIGVLQAFGWLYGFDNKIKGFAADYPIGTGLFLALFLLYEYVIWSSAKSRKRKEYRRSLVGASRRKRKP